MEFGTTRTRCTPARQFWWYFREHLPATRGGLRLRSFGNGIGLILLAPLLGLAISEVVSAAESNLLANGGFEMAGRLSQPRLRRVPHEGVRLEAADPLLPIRWTWSGSGSAPELRLVPEAHSGKFAAHVIGSPGSSLSLNMNRIEVVPNVTYQFGAWGRGAGPGAMVIYGHAFEGRAGTGSPGCRLHAVVVGDAQTSDDSGPYSDCVRGTDRLGPRRRYLG